MTFPSSTPSTTAISKHVVEEMTVIRELAFDEMSAIAGGPEITNQPQPD